MIPEPGTAWKGRWFAAAIADPREVVVRLDGDVVVIAGDGVHRRVRIERTAIVNPGGRRGPVQLELREDPIEALVVEGPGFLGALRAAGARAGVKRLDANRGPVRLIVAIGLIGALWIVAAWIWGVPMLAGWAAGKVPPEWERAFGESSLAQVAPREERVTDPRVVAPAAQVLAVLVAANPSRRDSFDLVVLRAPIVNAFALPGGFLVVTTGLLRTLPAPDELAAVLAHEMTHVELHHSLRQILARLGIRALIAIVLGDHGGLSNLVGGAAGMLGELTYSRNDETEADDGSLERLARAGIDPHAADRALGVIDSEGARDGSPDLSFLSTHPGTRARRARIERLVGRYEVTASAMLPDAEAWRAMQSAVGEDSLAAARRKPD